MLETCAINTCSRLYSSCGRKGRNMLTHQFSPRAAMTAADPSTSCYKYNIVFRTHDRRQRRVSYCFYALGTQIGFVRFRGFQP